MNQLKSSHIQRLFFFSISLLLFLSCEKKDSAVIDSIGASPVLSNATLAPDSVNTDSLSVGPIKLPEDVLTINSNVIVKVVSVNGPGDIKSVEFDLKSIKGTSIVATGFLVDDGNPPDAAKGDNLYSAKISFQIVRSDVGSLPVELFAESHLGYRSSSVILPLSITRSNKPPELSNLQAPDTVHTSTQTSFVVTVRASDPDGLADIRSVTRTTPSGLVLQLNDVGTNGDQFAGDGIFSETVSLAPAPPLGNYDFKFQAFDQLNFGSNIITKRIIVAQ